MNIENLIDNFDDVYYDSGFLVLIESHLPYLRKSTNVTFLQVTQQQGYKYEGDFFGLLDDLNVTKKYHHIVLRINALTSSADFDGNMELVMLPGLSEIDMLASIYQTSAEDSE